MAKLFPRAGKNDYLLVKLIVLVLVLVLSYKFMPILTSKLTPKASPTPQPTPAFLIDTENDGIYTNYQYGFRFKYSKDKFVVQFSKQDSSTWFNEQSDKVIESGPMGLNPDSGVWLNVSAFEADPLSQRFLRVYNLETGQTDEAGETKLYSTEKPNYKQVVYFSKTPESRGIEHSVSYVSEWILNKKIYIKLFFAAGDNKEQLLKQYKPAFDQVVNSMEFFEPSNTP